MYQNQIHSGRFYMEYEIRSLSYVLMYLLGILI